MSVLVESCPWDRDTGGREGYRPSLQAPGSCLRGPLGPLHRSEWVAYSTKLALIPRDDAGLA